MITSFRRFTCLGILLILIGCSGELKTYPVKGKVVFKGDGKPFQGKIYFESTKSPYTRSMANTNPDGTDNPAGRQLNRRTEFRILEIGNVQIKKPVDEPEDDDDRFFKKNE